MNLDKIVRLLGMRYATAALVLVAVLALYGAAAMSRPAGQPGAASAGVDDPVTSAVLVCPGREGGRLSLQGASEDFLRATRSGRPPSGGRVDVLRAPGGAAAGSLTTQGGRWTEDLDDAEDSFTVWASGALAAGLEAEQTTHWPEGDDRGLAGVRCARPGTDLWFLGPGPVGAESIQLHLTNVDARPAAVDVTALSGEGPLDTTDGRGTPVPAYGTKVVTIGESAEGLGEIVRTAADLALRVRATGGRVAASLRVRIADGEGIEWLPLSPAPAASLVVPGVPGGEGRRRLLVAVPGQEDASIRLQVITADGAFAPEGQDSLDAPAGTVTTVDLDRALSGKPAAVRLAADRPILAGFAAERGADVAYGTATPALGRGSFGVVADGRFDTSLTLTAPRGAATVRITPVGPQGPGTPKDVPVPADRTVEVRLTAPAGGEKGYGVLVAPRPGSGPVHAARTLSTGKGGRALFTTLPIGPAVTTLRLPPAGESQGVLVP
ncbi:DUF5719 family protein [Actinomadura viridis]|uniref:Secreted protein n=1 Tax=Actinomadura viridis TaxID=58110 RepID=A0A931GKR7_9ACTN|nr:DUF5719 family protein [Actinomadura viridis]MBG6086691.1 hypothetical protein [Actinomadura viridis]